MSFNGQIQDLQNEAVIKASIKCVLGEKTVSTVTEIGRVTNNDNGWITFLNLRVVLNNCMIGVPQYLNLFKEALKEKFSLEWQIEVFPVEATCNQFEVQISQAYHAESGI
jgi:hypothetical protein